MNKKIICLLISGIFLMTMFSTINTSSKAECLSELSKTKDILNNNEIESQSLGKTEICYQLYYGNFERIGNTLYGQATIIFQFTTTFPFFMLMTFYNIHLPIDAPNENYTFYKVTYNEHIIQSFFHI